ncbi:probable xyloglucan endotransglucosylase/hydrolase protein 28 [Cynara cardunculus var. scolymus]|uniref:Xyloglucan endotransglucosylase/hydrolase n=1 Tax=Cynara cardunculus var. scolymus TaxID=59895 RepID=A0A103XUT0_CYNCS|nr:probable xyloglucan endotransglucosylase/hydrolase protein 28 [Cynara cardunculus var. scolymus]KVH97308.1 Concanavalin A-like lectin/glucanase superfamily [Cynara cardunculus var. scolymus]
MSSSSSLRLVILLFTITVFKPTVSLNPSFVSFSETFSLLYGYQNIVPSNDDKSVQISMTKSSPGSGFVSRSTYHHGFFTASIKLPNNTYSAGVVATFYAQNNAFNRDDEIDFEFLGHIRGEGWVLQTNLYGNGSVHRGREEKFTLPFDPSQDFHDYSILWNTGRVVFYVDGLPIREVQKVEAMGGDFPSKPLFLYGTIWNGSDWATHNGRYKVDFSHGPFVTGYAGFILNGCPMTQSPASDCQVPLPDGLSSAERSKMQAFRSKYMTYSYCHDTGRYKTSLPECEAGAPVMQPAKTPVVLSPVEPPVSGESHRFGYIQY